MKKEIIREINGRKYRYVLDYKKTKGSKFLTQYYRYDGPVKGVYAQRFDTLTKNEVAALDAGFKKGLSIKTLQLNISERFGKKAPSASSLYQWFKRRGVKRSPKKNKRK